MKPSRSVIRRIAAEASQNVASIGSCGADSHNITNIEHAIVCALEWKPKRKKRK